MARNKTKKFVIDNFPQWAVCYLFNADPSYLEDDEIKMIDDYLEQPQKDLNAIYLHPADFSEETHFSYFPEFGGGCECGEMTFLYEVKTKTRNNK